MVGFFYPLGDRGDQGPPGEPPKLKPSMMMEVKGEKGDAGERGTKGFFGLKGQWSQQNNASTFRTIDHCLFSVTILNIPRSSYHCAAALPATSLTAKAELPLRFSEPVPWKALWGCVACVCCLFVRAHHGATFREVPWQENFSHTSNCVSAFPAAIA